MESHRLWLDTIALHCQFCLCQSKKKKPTDIFSHVSNFVYNYNLVTITQLLSQLSFFFCLHITTNGRSRAKVLNPGSSEIFIHLLFF